MTTITKERLQWLANISGRDDIDDIDGGEIRELALIALASLEAKPVASCIIEDGCMCVDGFGEYVGHSLPDGTHQLYAAPPVPDKLPREYIRGWPLAHSDYAEGWNDCREAMLHGAEPVSQTYNLPELIEGMEVSIDVSTCDADLGNRYFGTVTEALELDTAKNGYILLVQDAEPNFDVNGNSPGTPDSWISCSERMPKMGERQCYVLAADFKNTYTPNIPNTQVGVYGDWFNDGNPTWDDGDGEDLYLKEVTHWMPLPEPPQEVK
ncbi:TPA: DUF551 domain-containing protein [Escherichia coli]|nr:DUF551 domain-containing protein [Escherichia coli]